MLLLDKSLRARQTENAHGPLGVSGMSQYTLRGSRAAQRDGLKRHLTQAGVGCETCYPTPMHQQEWFARMPRTALPVAKRAAGERSAFVDAIFGWTSSATVARAL
jgi:dTDP-4-amino-4,6-dideoxygalactose transaminase